MITLPDEDAADCDDCGCEFGFGTLLVMLVIFAVAAALVWVRRHPGDAILSAVLAVLAARAGGLI